MKKSTKIFILLFLLFLLDRITKYLAINKLHKSGVYFNKLLSLHFTQNTGIAFGLKINQIIIEILTIIIIIILNSIFIKHIKKHEYTKSFLIGVIIIGAFSNLIDRIYYNGVIDFLEIFSLSIINFADIYISISIIVYILISSKKSNTKHII
ncbi:MAG: signal peptidase II [Patescibacteria group bacterium]|nr:signal peptidase II [Patescibacteria group bacterium]MDD4695171.1 signal peptidase II [Patescibacteria group bacterium]